MWTSCMAAVAFDAHLHCAQTSRAQVLYKARQNSMSMARTGLLAGGCALLWRGTDETQHRLLRCFDTVCGECSDFLEGSSVTSGFQQGSLALTVTSGPLPENELLSQ